MQKEKLAIIVPYRNRKKHLSEFLPYMEQYLKDYDFKIFIVEQANSLPFNRGRLLNIGFAEAKDNFDYFVFHDVDYIPVDGDYSFNENITHLAGQIEEYGWKLPYEYFLGGVFMSDKASFLKINGFANEYWGWGEEDNELHDRCVLLKIPVNRRPGKYRSLAHDRYSHVGLEKENVNYREGLKERMVQETFIDGFTNLTYKKLGEEKLSAHGVMIKADFEIKREIKTSRLSILKKDIRFKLGQIKRSLLKKIK